MFRRHADGRRVSMAQRGVRQAETGWAGHRPVAGGAPVFDMPTYRPEPATGVCLCLNRVVRWAMRLNLIAALFLVLFAAVTRGFAVEKSSIARVSQLAIQGQLTDGWSFPWFDGWHFRGKLKVSRTLWGVATPSETLDYRFVCRGCPMWPRPDWSRFRGSESIWFLRGAGPGVWTGAGVQPGDPGVRGLADLSYYEELFKVRRSQTAKPVK